MVGYDEESAYAGCVGYDGSGVVDDDVAWVVPSDTDTDAWADSSVWL